MKLIEYRDTCVITRMTGSDEWDNPITETIYDGNCLYEEGSVKYADKIIIKSPVLYIPEQTEVRINDTVVVTTEADRVINSVVKSVRDINLAVIVKQKVTRVELKQGQEE